MSTTATLDYASAAPEVARVLYEGARLVAASGLEPGLLVLIDLRASQLNRCGFCLALHAREGERLGESLDRLAGIPAWREAPWYSARERAALEWTESLTLLAEAPPADDLLARMKEHFDERELVYLTLAITAINTYNRFNVAFGTSAEKAEAVFKMLHPETAPTHP